MRQVVITGLGVVSPLGNHVDAFWDNMILGKSGIGPITLFDASMFPIRIGGEVKDLQFESITQLFPEVSNCRDRKVFFALAAANQAIDNAKLSEDMAGALLHIGIGLETFCLEDLTPYADSPDLSGSIVSSLAEGQEGRSLQTPLDLTCRILGNRYGFLRGRYTNCSACAAGTQVIGEAWQMLREGAAQVALAGATDSMLNPLGLGGFSLLRVLSGENETPQRACRPFDASRTGTVLSEGAAFVALETLDHALARRARVYAEIVGYGSSLDAYRVSDPDNTGRGAVQSMSKALATAGLGADQIDCVNAHGTGTVKNDVVETVAVKEALGTRAYEIPVHAVKSMTGHMIAASGATEAAVAALTLHKRIVPPTINIKKTDKECDLDYVADGARDFYGETVLSNSFGFGGQNATLILRRYD